MIKPGKVQFHQHGPSVKAEGNPKKNNYTENSSSCKENEHGLAKFPVPSNSDDKVHHVGSETLPGVNLLAAAFWSYPGKPR